MSPRSFLILFSGQRTALTAFLLTSFLQGAQAADVTWQGTTTSWATTANWSSGALPTGSDRVIFGASGASLSPATGADRTVGGVLFNGTANYNVSISSGVLYVGNLGIEVVSGTQNFNSGNLRLNTGGATTILNNGTLNINSGIMYHRTAGSGDKVLTFDGSGTTTVANIQRRSNTYDMSLIKNGTGTLTINAEVTAAAGTASGYITGTTTINAGKIRINAEGSMSGNPTAFNAAHLTLNGGTLGAFATFAIDDANRGVTLGVNGGTFDVETGFTLTIANAITGTGSLTKSGPGTLVLSTANSYLGATLVSGGILNVQNSSALGTTAGGVTVSNGATLQVQGDIDLGTEAISITGSGTTGQAGALVNVSGTNIMAGQITLGSAADTTIASQSGQLNLTNTTTIVGGNRAVTLTGAGNGTLAAGMDTTVTGLTKSGTGMWTLTGVSTYTGATTISGGTLNLESTASLGNTAVTVANGATLAGSASIGGSVTVASGGTLSVGSALTPGSTGTLTIGGGLSLNQDSLLLFDLGTSSDQIAVTGNLLLNGVVRVTEASGFGSAASYTLITYTGTLADAGLAIANPMAGYNYTISTATAGQVNLLTDQTGLSFWDASNATANGVLEGGDGTWSNAPVDANWTNGSDSIAHAGWTAGQTAVFTGTAGNVQVADTMVVGGLQFGSSYTLTDVGGNVGKISISAAATEVRVNPSAIATMDVAIVGAGGLSKTGGGTLVLNKVNTYSGPTTVKEGTLKIGVNNALSTTTALTVGADGTAANFDASSASQTVSSLQVASNSSSNSTITVGSGQTLTVNGTGSLKIGILNTYKAKTNAVFTGGGSLVVNNASGTFEAGIQGNTSSTVGPGGEGAFDSALNTNTTVADMTGLGSFSATVNLFRVGYGVVNSSTLSLSNGANTINANAIQVADSGTYNAGTTASNMILGTGTNVLQTNLLTVGISKGVGTLKFASQTAGSAGTVVIGGKTGATTNIIVGSTEGTNTGATPNGTLDLRGHLATVTAGTLAIGKRDIAGNGGATGTVNFDTGTFTVNQVTLGSMAGNSLGTATGTLNIGGGSFTVNVGGSFNMATFANTNTSGKVIATLNLTGGVFTSNADILEVGGTNSNTTNTVTTLNLNGGTLDMTGHNIGSATQAIDTVTLAAGTLKDVGQINGGAAISKTTTGTLIMEGNNTYTGTTAVTAGTVLVNNTYSSTSTATGTNAVTVSSGATLGGNGRIAGPVTVSSGATLAPGGNATSIAANASGLNTSIGTLKIDNTLTVSSGANVALQLQTGGTHGLNATFNATTDMLTSVSGTSTDGGNDRLLVTGNLTLDSNAKITVSLASGYTPSYHNVFDLLDWVTINGGSSIASAFYDFAGTGKRTGDDNLSYGLVLPSLSSYGNDYYWDVSQFGTTGVISIVPEPGRMMLLLLGCGVVGLRRRRNRLS